MGIDIFLSMKTTLTDEDIIRAGRAIYEALITEDDIRIAQWLREPIGTPPDRIVLSDSPGEHEYELWTFRTMNPGVDAAFELLGNRQIIALPRNTSLRLECGVAHDYDSKKCGVAPAVRAISKWVENTEDAAWLLEKTESVWAA